MRVYLRQGNIVFSKHFVDVVTDNDIILTRKNKFGKNGIIINHGNSKDITIGKKVNELYLINKPRAIHYCSNKMDNYNLLREFYPKTYNSISDVKKFPILVKPLNGHHGYGIEKFNSFTGAASFLESVNEPYIIQDFIPIKHEFRFNVFNGKVFQVSRRIATDSKTDKGGLIFNYVSLGSDAKISNKFWDFVHKVIDTLHNKIGYDLGDYCIDVIKGTDNNYYISELNSAYGLGQYTLDKLLLNIDSSYNSGELDNYRVR